jgi:hypothetical protein
VGETTAAGTRCPRCSAAVRPGAPWCTQCYAPVGAPVEPAAAPRPVPLLPDAPQPVPSAPVLVAELPTGTWPCTACSAANDLADAACRECGTPFLAAARSAPPTLVLPVVGDLLEMSPVRRVGTALGAVLAFVLIAAVLGLLLA